MDADRSTGASLHLHRLERTMIEKIAKAMANRHFQSASFPEHFAEQRWERFPEGVKNYWLMLAHMAFDAMHENVT